MDYTTTHHQLVSSAEWEFSSVVASDRAFTTAIFDFCLIVTQRVSIRTSQFLSQLVVLPSCRRSSNTRAQTLINTLGPPGQQEEFSLSHCGGSVPFFLLQSGFRRRNRPVNAFKIDRRQAGGRAHSSHAFPLPDNTAFVLTPILIEYAGFQNTARKQNWKKPYRRREFHSPTHASRSFLSFKQTTTTRVV